MKLSFLVKIFLNNFIFDAANIQENLPISLPNITISLNLFVFLRTFCYLATCLRSWYLNRRCDRAIWFLRYVRAELFFTDYFVYALYTEKLWVKRKPEEATCWMRLKIAELLWTSVNRSSVEFNLNPATSNNLFPEMESPIFSRNALLEVEIERYFGF